MDLKKLISDIENKNTHISLILYVIHTFLYVQIKNMMQKTTKKGKLYYLKWSQEQNTVCDCVHLWALNMKGWRGRWIIWSHGLNWKMSKSIKQRKRTVRISVSRGLFTECQPDVLRNKKFVFHILDLQNKAQNGPVYFQYPGYIITLVISIFTPFRLHVHLQKRDMFKVI